MVSVSVDVVATIAAFTAWAGACVLAARVSRNGRSIDEVGSHFRKVHVAPTSRIGGLAIVAGIIAAAVLEWELGGEPSDFLILLLCAAPAFATGLIEDLAKRGNVFVRLAMTAVSATLAFVLLDARITHVDVPGIDRLLLINGFAFMFTVFAITGVANGINVIDGLNGLSGATALFASVGLAAVAWIAGDALVFSPAVVLAASIAGFLVVNFPRGRIFLGDGGAYLVGLLLAVLSVLLVHRNSEVSPWFPLLLLIYPVWETLFSAFRRKLSGRSAGDADALHLHTLVYKRIVRWHGYSATPAAYVTRNSIASLCLWVLPGMCLAFALAFWDQTVLLQCGAATFIVLYVAVYRSIVRFRVPAWLIVRPRDGMASIQPDEGENASA